MASSSLRSFVFTPLFTFLGFVDLAVAVVVDEEERVFLLVLEADLCDLLPFDILRLLLCMRKRARSYSRLLCRSALRPLTHSALHPTTRLWFRQACYRYVAPTRYRLEVSLIVRTTHGPCTWLVRTGLRGYWAVCCPAHILWISRVRLPVFTSRSDEPFPSLYLPLFSCSGLGRLRSCRRVLLT